MQFLLRRILRQVDAICLRAARRQHEIRVVPGNEIHCAFVLIDATLTLDKLSNSREPVELSPRARFNRAFASVGTRGLRRCGSEQRK